MMLEYYVVEGLTILLPLRSAIVLQKASQSAQSRKACGRRNAWNVFDDFYNYN